MTFGTTSLGQDAAPVSIGLSTHSRENEAIRRFYLANTAYLPHFQLILLPGLFG